MAQIYDVIIIGAGPAGATLARNLRKNLRILLLDKRNLSDASGFVREKCCGGLLAPAAQKELARQGLGIPGCILTGPQTFSVKSVDFDNGITRFYQRHYININREKFDRWLVSLVPENVDLEFSSVFRSFEEDEKGFIIAYEKGNEPRTARGMILVGADGASSTVRARAFPGKPCAARYVSVQEHYEAHEELPYYVSIFNRGTSDFYSWIIQKEGELLVGAAIPEGTDVGDRYRNLVMKLREKGFVKGESLKRSGAVIMRPLRPGSVNPGAGGIALAGEAAGLISPSSAEGISYALKSGLILADSINESPAKFIRRYRAKLIGLRGNLLYKRLKVFIMYNGFLRKLVMKSGILGMDVTEEVRHD